MLLSRQTILLLVITSALLSCQQLQPKSVRLSGQGAYGNTPGIQGNFQNGIPSLPNFENFPQQTGYPGFQTPQRKLAFSAKFKLSVKTKFLGFKACKGDINVQVWSLDGFPESQKNLANQIDLPNSYVDCSLLGVNINIQTLARHFLSGNNQLQSGASSAGINQNTVFTGLLQNIASQDGLIYMRKLGDVQFNPALLMAYLPFDVSENQLANFETNLAAIATAPGSAPGSFAVSIKSERIGNYRAKAANKNFSNVYRITRNAYGANPKIQLQVGMPEEVNYYIARENGFSSIIELNLCMPLAGLEGLMGGGGALGGGALGGGLANGPLGDILDGITLAPGDSVGFAPGGYGNPTLPNPNQALGGPLDAAINRLRIRTMNDTPSANIAALFNPQAQAAGIADLGGFRPVQGVLAYDWQAVEKQGSLSFTFQVSDRLDQDLKYAILTPVNSGSSVMQVQLEDPEVIEGFEFSNTVKVTVPSAIAGTLGLLLYGI